MKGEEIRRIFFFVLGEVVSLDKSVLCGYFWDFGSYFSFFIMCVMRSLICRRLCINAMLGDKRVVIKAAWSLVAFFFDNTKS